MKLLLFISFIALAHATVYPKGTYIKSCSEIDIDGNKLCAFAILDTSFDKYRHKLWSCIIFDECSYIENENGILVDKRISGCTVNNINHIYDTKLAELNQKLDLLLKIVDLKKSMSNLELDKTHTESKDFFQ